jgi:hypothetical protein
LSQSQGIAHLAFWTSALNGVKKKLATRSPKNWHQGARRLRPKFTETHVKKILILLGLLLAVLLGSVLLFFVKPEWAFDAAPFLWSGHHKKMIAERTKILVDDLCRKDVNGCIALTDPALVRKRGEDLTRLHFEGLIAVLRFINLGPDDVRIDEITLDSDSKSAQVKVSIRIAGKWEPHRTYRWVRVDGNWYFTF